MYAMKTGAIAAFLDNLGVKGNLHGPAVNLLAILNGLEEKFKSTNIGSPKLLNSLSTALPLVKNGMSSEEIHKVRGVIADAIDQLQAGA